MSTGFRSEKSSKKSGSNESIYSRKELGSHRADEVLIFLDLSYFLSYEFLIRSTNKRLTAYGIINYRLKSKCKKLSLSNFKSSVMKEFWNLRAEENSPRSDEHITRTNKLFTSISWQCKQTKM